MQINSSIQKKYEVYMRCVTWSRDSHGLFDYESKNIAKKNIKTQTGGKILRVNDDVEFVSIRTRPEDVDSNAKPMIIVKQTNGQFQVHNDTIVAETPRDSEGNPIPDEDINNKMFVVVRNTKSAQNNLVSTLLAVNLSIKSCPLWIFNEASKLIFRLSSSILYLFPSLIISFIEYIKYIVSSFNKYLPSI